MSIERKMLVADTKKNNFKMVEADYEELQKQKKERSKEIIKKGIKIALAILTFVIAVEIIYALRSFDSYDVRHVIERSRSSATQYVKFNEGLLEYSNDGISCIAANNEVVWNQSFEMISPQVEICGQYLAIYDDGGTEIFVLTESGLQNSIETSSPIRAVCIAEQGTTAVLMKEDGKSQVKLFDIKGNELANGVFYEKQGGFPVDIALSHDATKMAVDMVDVSAGNVSTTIQFYNFGSVGQSEIDNNVGTYTFENILVPEIDYVSDSKMIGIGTGKILVFDGKQRPKVSKEIAIEEEILSCFYNNNYIGIVYDNVNEGKYCHVEVLDFYGRTIMENDIDIVYDEVEFLDNNEICARNATECQIFTTHSIRKFAYTFDREIFKILSGENGENYTFIFKDTIEEVKLK